MFTSLMIANRGEIAVRVVRTARRMGLRTIAVYSEADQDALHAQVADEAVCIGEAAARASYLRVESLMEAARRSGAEALHPGYGFLSESPELARACVAAGLVWVGPHAVAIEQMGSKAEARRLASTAGVPVVPGYEGEDQSEATLARAARRIGFPVLIKASAGGGGRGIRAVFEPQELPRALMLARQEALASFADGRLIIEKYIEQARHVEVQLLGDKHGNLIHLFDRDCSVQRKYQKLIEEAPAPGLKQATRDRLYGHALRIAHRIQYDSVGTVEFVVDADSEDCYFLEVNTRLQVEHTVTEAVTGLDLVELQLRVAAGEPLGLTQDRVRLRGHAIEARLNAEHPDLDFQPAVGRILSWRPPEGLRVDAGVERGSSVGVFYDSLLAKLIAHGPDRQSVLNSLRSGLDETVVLGLATNRAFLVDVLGAPAFARAELTTAFLAQLFPDGWKRQSDPANCAARAAAAIFWLAAYQEAKPGFPTPWETLRGFRVLAQSGSRGRSHFSVMLGEIRSEVIVEKDGGGLLAKNETGHTRIAGRLEAEAFVGLIDGIRRRIPVAVTEEGVHLRTPDFEGYVSVIGSVETATAGSRQRSGSASNGPIVAPMPGILVDCRVAVGDIIESGQIVAIIESMKLLVEVRSPEAGRVSRIDSDVGAVMPKGGSILLVDPLSVPE